MEEKKVEIRFYEDEPPVLEQCQGCANAIIERFEPKNCPLIEDIRTLIVNCLLGRDTFAEGTCSSFQAGSPRNIISLSLLGGI